MPCECDFECKDNLVCKDNICKEDCSNPPEGMKCCGVVFKKISSKLVGETCGCDFECSVGICFENKCEKLINPTLSCPKGTNVKKDETLICNLIIDSTNLGDDHVINFVLEAGNGLNFSGICEGSQCEKTYTVNELKNKGAEIKMNALAGGNSSVVGKIKYVYEGKTVEEELSDLNPHIYFCGDGNVDEGETKKDCCVDVGVREYTWFRPWNEMCVDNDVDYEVNWAFLVVGVLIVGLGLYFGRRVKLEQTKRKIVNKIKKEQEKVIGESEEKRKQTEKKIEDLNKQITEKEEKIKQIKEKEKEEIKFSSEERSKLLKIRDDIKVLRDQIRVLDKRAERDKKQYEDKINEITNENKQEIDELLQTYKKRYGHDLILDNGYLRFKKSLIDPSEKGKSYHRWIFEKEHGRKIKPGYEIHHKDFCKLNNDIDNLEELSIEEHKEKHRNIYKN